MTDEERIIIQQFYKDLNQGRLDWDEIKLNVPFAMVRISIVNGHISIAKSYRHAATKPIVVTISLSDPLAFEKALMQVLTFQRT